MGPFCPPTTGIREEPTEEENSVPWKRKRKKPEPKRGNSPKHTLGREVPGVGTGFEDPVPLPVGKPGAVPGIMVSKLSLYGFLLPFPTLHPRCSLP